MAAIRAIVVLLAIGVCESATISTNQLKVFENLYKSVYYNPETKQPLKCEVEDASRLPDTRIGFRGMPCACDGYSCGCCAGINITRLGLDQKACTNLTYDPREFAIKMQVTMNDMTIYTNQLSARNPPPACFSLPYIPEQLLQMCARFHDIHMPDSGSLQACMDFETRVVQSPIMVLHFDCMRINNQGITWIKPDEIEDSVIDVETSGIPGSEVYDEVNFETADSHGVTVLTTTTLSPEDEQEIGQLKL
ncbi:uncharacterized protein LOC124414705 [Diprion similis]|uniref:uncharacterized protein LOC124414705 n=1 Tax=Diprion similis TaxID=362088 RepID=UPI001EF8E726|nr:uncharacterized protein LOC124414705 [Diprion similis]